MLASVGDVKVGEMQLGLLQNLSLKWFLHDPSQMWVGTQSVNVKIEACAAVACNVAEQPTQP